MTDRRDGAPDEPEAVPPPAAEPEPAVDGARGDVAGRTEPDADAAPTEAHGTGTDDPDFAGPEADTDETIVTEPLDPERTTAAGTAVTAGAGATAAQRRPMRPGERRAAQGPPAAAAPTPSQQAVHIEDRASRYFVLLSIGVFVLILLNALLLGEGGLLSPAPTPRPSAGPTALPSASSAASPSLGASPSASGSPGASGSPAASPSPAASASAAPSPS
jgi:hypothetical protein